MTTNIYMLRQCLSGVAALLLLFGTFGLYLAQRPSSGWLGTVALVIAFIGGALLVAVEFTDVFVLRALAQIAPDSVAPLDKSPLMNAGFASAAGLFALGWLLLSISVWRARVLPLWPALATLLGLFLIPGLQASLGTIGAIAGNLVFGAGLMGLGWASARADRPAD